MKTKVLQEIIVGCKQRNAIDQRKLFEEYSDLLYAISYRYMADEAAAKDILQDSFIKIFKSIDQFDTNKGSIKAWMRKIVVNTALKQLDVKKIKSIPLAIEHHGAALDPQVISSLDNEMLVELITKLPDGYRQVFNLNVIEGYSHKEIAKIIGIEEVTSRSKLSRAKQLLRKKLLSIKSYDAWIQRS